MVQKLDQGLWLEGYGYQANWTLSDEAFMFIIIA